MPQKYTRISGLAGFFGLPGFLGFFGLAGLGWRYFLGF
jgi:hypothetical protein